MLTDNWRPGNSELTGVSLDEFEDKDGSDPCDGWPSFMV
jgi:hypothetical protein